MAEKKSFLLYFDSYPSIALLPPDQRGWLFSALFAYAMAAAKQPETWAVEILDQFPDMGGEARMAFRFLSTSICRDTQEWHRRFRRKTAAGEGEARKPDHPKAGTADGGVDESLRHYVALLNRPKKE